MTEALQILIQFGALGALVIFVAGLLAKRWMMTNSHEEIIAQYDKRLSEKDERIVEWKGIAAERLAQNERLKDALEKLTEPREKQG